MKARTRTTAVSLLILCLCALPAHAQNGSDSTHSTEGYPALKPAVEITEMHLLGNPTVGATVHLQVRFTAHVDGEGTVMLRFPKHLAPPNRNLGEKYRTEQVMLRTGKQYVKNYTLVAEQPGGSMVSVIVQAEDPPKGYAAAASEHINVLSGADSAEVYAPGDTTRKHFTAVTGNAGAGPNGKSQSTSSYTVSVSGKVTSMDQDQFREEGLYGTEVDLWFRYDDEPRTLYHPVGFGEEHVRYDVIEEDGSYHFNFSFSESDPYDELLVLVSSSNDAAFLSVGQGSWIVGDGSGSETFFGSSQGVAYDISGMGTDLSISDADIEVNSQDGAILRNMMLSREFLEERYSGTLPFSMPVIAVHRENLDPGIAGLFCPPGSSCNSGGNVPNIEIDNLATDVSTVSHEYGHYVHYQMWGGDDDDFSTATNRVTEGWAIFYSFAARNYANEAYGDALRKYDDNTEEDAFETDPTDENGDPYRFEGMRYAYGSHPDYAAFACYLWSLYDEYDGGDFEVALYDNGDNDDISGYDDEVFEIFRTETEGDFFSTVVDFHDSFKGQFNGRRQSSVEEIYDFMFSDLIDVPTSNPMRPSQVDNASVAVGSDALEFQWDAQNYGPVLQIQSPVASSRSGSYARAGGAGKGRQAAPRRRPSGASPSAPPLLIKGRKYGNYENGYHIYRDGNLIATLPRGTTTFTYSQNDGAQFGTFKISSYNSAGDASSPETINISAPLEITKTNWLTEVGDYQGVCFGVSVSNGDGPYTIEWFDETAYPIDEPPVRTAYGTEDTYYRETGAPGDDFFLQAKVTDATGATDVTPLDRIFVETGNAGACDCPPGQICDILPLSESLGMPTEFALEGTTPNPVHAGERTDLHFALPEEAQVEIALYDVLGREVERIVDERMPPGFHHAPVEANGLSSGVYLYRMRTDTGFTDTGKLVVVK